VGIMKDRAILAIGSPAEVITEESMRSAYGAEVRILDLDGTGGRRVCVPLLSRMAGP